MSRSQSKNRDPFPIGTNVKNTGFYGKMATRRQADHESGFYEDISDDYIVYRPNTKNSPSIGKRQKMPTGDILPNCDKRTKRQMASSSVKKADSLVSASMGLYNSSQKEPIIPESNINTYNISNNGTNYKMTCQTSNNSSKKIVHIKNNNNNNNTISTNKEIKQKNVSNNINSKICSNATNNNHYTTNNNNNNNGNQNLHRKVSTTEIVEVSDSDSETEDRNTSATTPSKSKLKTASGTINKTTLKNMPTYVVSGSSSVSNHSMPNSYEQQASGSKLQTLNNNNCNSNKADMKKGTGTTGSDNDSNNVNVDIERLQREIEEVTQVRTNCKSFQLLSFSFIF